MKLTPLLAAVALLAAPVAGRAQASAVSTATVVTADAPPTTYRVEYDSLQRRAARVRALTQTRIAELHSSFVSLFGTSRRTKSLAHIQGSNPAGAVAAAYSYRGYRLVKKEITKHKTRSADVAKVYYYDLSGRLLLAELYQQGQLARQQLYEYPVRRSGKSVFQPFRSTEWVRGDYLSLRVRDAAETSSQAHRYYFTELRRPE